MLQAQQPWPSQFVAWNMFTLSVFSGWKLAVACFDHMNQAHKTVSIFKVKTHTTRVNVRKVLPIMRFQFLLQSTCRLKIHSTRVTVWHQILHEYVMSSTYSMAVVPKFDRDDTHHLVRAAKYKFIVSLGAAYGSTDYVHLQDKSRILSHLWFTTQLGVKWS